MEAALGAVSAEATTASWGIPVGTPVHDVAGEKVGHVADADSADLVVERGWFLVRDYRVRLADVDRYEDGTLYLKLTKDEVLRGGSEASEDT